MSQSNPNEQVVTRRLKQSPSSLLQEDYVRPAPKTLDNYREANPQLSSKRIALFILGMVERVDFDRMPIVILGRFDEYDDGLNQLDLSDYGAINRGVSRVHCQLEYRDGQIVVTDLGSTNGTYLGGKRLEPNQPYIMARGDDLVVGRLPVQIISGR